MGKKMQEVEECDVPVVTEDFLADAAKGAALLKIPTHTISSWGAPRHSLPTDEPEYGKSFKSKGERRRPCCLCERGHPSTKIQKEKLSSTCVLCRPPEGAVDSEGFGCCRPRVGARRLAPCARGEGCGLECCPGLGGHCERYQLLLQAAAVGGRQWPRVLRLPLLGPCGHHHWRDKTGGKSVATSSSLNTLCL